MTAKILPIRPDFDFSVFDHGSIFLLHPHSKAAQQWIAEHIPGDAYRLGNAVVVEHRFIAEIVKGIRADGMTIR